MNRKHIALFLLGLMVSVSAYALPSRGRQVQTSIFHQDVPDDSCGEIDPNEPCYTSTGTFIQCLAKGSEGQMCYVTVYDALTKVKLCGMTKSAGGCQCNATTKVTSGSCQYAK